MSLTSEQAIDLVSRTLTYEQIEHVNRVLKILDKNPFYIDMSTMGLGKTFCAIAVASVLKLGIFVLAPNIQILRQWEVAAEKFYVPILGSISYTIGRGQAGFELSHDYLERVGTQRKVKFRATNQYISLLGGTSVFEKGYGADRMQFKVDYGVEGVMVVMDECHAGKNETITMECIRALTEPIINSTSKSRVAMLSATLFDKKPMVRSVLKMLHVLEEDNLITRTAGVRGSSSQEGFQRVYRKALMVDPEKTKKITSSLVSSTDVIDKTFNLFTEVFVPNWSSRIEERPATDSEGKVFYPDIKNFYGNLADDVIPDLIAGVAVLGKLVDKISQKRLSIPGYKIPEIEEAHITHALQRIEKAKVSLFVRMTVEILQQDPSAKVIIGVNYDHTQELVEATLGAILTPLGYRILGPFGKESPVSREQNFALFKTRGIFQGYRYSVLVTKTSIISTGLNLDDTVGDERRYTLISPSFNFTVSHQVAARTYRTNTTKSQPIIRFVYSKAGFREMKIIDALKDKARIHNAVRCESSVLFPTELEDLVEPDDPELFPGSTMEQMEFFRSEQQELLELGKGKKKATVISHINKGAIEEAIGLVYNPNGTREESDMNTVMKSVLYSGKHDAVIERLMATGKFTRQQFYLEPGEQPLPPSHGRQDMKIEQEWTSSMSELPSQKAIEFIESLF